MRELRLILDASRRLIDRGEQGVLATVVKVEGSTYRRPGARLLITPNEAVGGVSGGCLESDLARKAWWRTELGPALVKYDSTADAESAWQLGLGCNGVVHILLERIASGLPDPLGLIRRFVDVRETGVIATVIRADVAIGGVIGERIALDIGGQWAGGFGSEELADRARLDAAECLAGGCSGIKTYALPLGEAEVAFEVVQPTVRLLVFGGGFDAAPVVAAAKALGWSVALIERRPGAAHRTEFATADRVMVANAKAAVEQLRPDGRTAAVVMNHSFPDDCDAVSALLQSQARYVGVLGPRARTEKILEDVAGLDTAHLDRLYAPIGLDVGADGPEEIAASIVAEITAMFAGRAGGHLRDRPGPIHRHESVSRAEALS